MVDRRKHPKDHRMYGVYNLGRFVSVHYRRKDAIAWIESWLGKPWDDVKDHVEIHKVVVSKCDS